MNTMTERDTAAEVGAHARRVSTRLVIGLTVASLGLATVAIGLGTSLNTDFRREHVAIVPTGLGAPYDKAVTRVIRTNRLLEERQTDLTVALRDGAPAAVIARLRREVVAFERRYATTIKALAEATR